MESKDNGGSAFPVIGHRGVTRDGIHYSSPDEMGMTLRDFFAAWALLGEYLRECSDKTNACGPYSGRAGNAYAQADAMLSERIQ